ncbi:MAG: YlmC/YmxH family sporulation protein [Clostridia bacterium]|nr:YlmC/YmxH family sporulation protein [Clostridia bacterium]
MLVLCSINELKTKEVVNVSDGARLGFVSDVEIDLKDGRLTAVIVPGAYRMMGFWGKEEDIIIKWENIKKIGEDIIIIDNIN